MFIHEAPREQLRYEMYLDGSSDRTEWNKSEGLDYLAETNKTASGVFRCDHITKGELINALRQVQHNAILMDKFKKAMFRKRTRTEAGLAYTDEEIARNPTRLQIPSEFADLFHGIIGNITEVGEQAEILIKYLEEGTVDKVNVFEEIGDNLWYLSRLVAFVRTSFLQAMRANIAKLRFRHGEAFSKEKDGDRKLALERAVLVEFLR